MNVVVELDVLEDRSESNGVVNFWFLLTIESSTFGVAASFNVKNTLIALSDFRLPPAVLIITDQSSLRISRQGSLSCTRESKKKSDVLILDAFIA